LAKQFQIKRFLEIDQSKTEIVCGSHVCKWIKKSMIIGEKNTDLKKLKLRFLTEIGRFY
jgi:hypothetical protein